MVRDYVYGIWQYNVINIKIFQSEIIVDEK